MWLIAAFARRRDALEKAIVPQLPEEVRGRFKVHLVEEAIAALEVIVANAETQETTVRGYSVRVKRTPLDPEETRRRREAIARVVARSMKGLREND